MEIIPAPEVKGVKETGQHKIAIYPLFDVTFYMYNFDQEKQFFQDQRVRQALLQAIDRQLIRDTIFVGYGQVAVGMQPELSPAFAPDRMTAQYPYDPEAGRRLLEEAGWQLNGDGIREKDGQKFEITLIFPSGDATVESMATEIQRAWSEVGIKVKVEPQPGDVLLQNLEAHTFDLALLAFGFTPEASQTLLFTCNAYTTGFNFMHYCNERYDELDNLQKREFDRANRIALLIEQSNIIWTDLPVGPLRFGVGRTGYTNRLHNFYPNGYGFLWSLAYVWIEH
jgi:peptide/nickel transport system substrate-binding protein